MSSSTVIRTNVRSLNAHRNLSSVGSSQEKASQRLSSGKKINSAADDAAGLAISNKMKAQIRGLDMAYKNSQDAVSLIQTAEGSLSEIDNMAQRIRELAVQAASDTNTGGAASDRSKLADEMDQLLEEITNMAGRTEFNTKVLTTGTYQVGKTVSKSDGTAISSWKDPATFNFDSYEFTDANGADQGKFIGGNGISFSGDTATTASFYLIKTTSTGAITVTGADNNSANDVAALSAGSADAAKPGAGNTVRVATAEDIKKDSDGFLYIEGNNGGTGRYYLVADGSVSFKTEAQAEKMTIADKGVDGIDAVLDNSSLTFQVGANNRSNDDSNARQSISMNLSDVTADGLFGKMEYDDSKSSAVVKTAAELTSAVLRDENSSADDIAEVIDVIDAGLDIISGQRAKLGAVQNRLEYTSSNLQVSSENLNAANSRIEDADMATEMSNLTSANVLQQAATAMLSQANSSTQTVLQLLQ